ncbi:unnamed protein product [Symbiodinium sp. CCMP2456]|nr:unnamed protein product [Symbiodinium sp. CCMP2456]
MHQAPHDYSKWDRLAQALDDDEEDPMTWPVCQEIPWNTVGPLVDRVLDEHFGPERPEESGPIPGEAAEAVEADARFADPARVDLTLVSSMKNVGDEDLVSLFAAALPDANKDIWVILGPCAHASSCADLVVQDPNGEVRMMLDTLREFLGGVHPDDAVNSMGMCLIG